MSMRVLERLLVGAMMLRNVRNIDWDDHCELLPSFLVLAGGRGREVQPVAWIVAAALVAYFVWLRS